MTKQERIERRALLLTLGAGSTILNAERDNPVPRITLTASKQPNSSDEILSVAVCHFPLPAYPERIAHSIAKGTSVIGGPSTSYCTAIFVIKGQAESISRRGRVMTALLMPEFHERPTWWACDVVWDETVRKWLFLRATYTSLNLEIEVFDIDGLDAFAYPIPFKPSYKSPWPEPASRAAFFAMPLKSTANSVRRVSSASTSRGLTVVVIHELAGVIEATYNWATDRWSALPTDLR